MKTTFGKQNYQLLIGGIVILIIGYLLMIGGGSDNPNEFNEAELFSTIRITVAPILIVAGFVVIILGIMRKPKPTAETKTPAKEETTK